MIEEKKTKKKEEAHEYFLTSRRCVLLGVCGRQLGADSRTRSLDRLGLLAFRRLLLLLGGVSEAQHQQHQHQHQGPAHPGGVGGLGRCLWVAGCARTEYKGW